MKSSYILVINPGATSTKIAVYTNKNPVFLKTITHHDGDLKNFRRTSDQLGYRMELVLKEVDANQIPADEIQSIVARGGLLHPIESGIYEVNDIMVADLEKGVMGDHASNLGGLIARKLLDNYTEAKAYISDPVVVDELHDVARISGHPEFERISIFHALNQKSVARAHAAAQGTAYEDLNLVVAHLGSGVSIGAHQKGRVIDVNNALDGEGPFGPERSGTLPTGALARYCFEKASSLDDVKKMLAGEGGIFAYLGHKNAHQLEKDAKNGDAKALLIQSAMGYQISKEIGAMATVLKGEVDAIILTGGMAHNPELMDQIKEGVSFISRVYVYPGEDEMRALAQNGSMLLSGHISAKTYAGKSE